MIKQGHGCRVCEADKKDLSMVNHGYNISVVSLFGLRDTMYRVYRCNKCGAYWSECTSYWGCNSSPLTRNEWFCFGRDIKDLKSYEELYQKMVQRKWYEVDWQSLGLITISLLFACMIGSWALRHLPVRDPVAVVKPLVFDDIRVTAGSTTILDFRAGYLTNHTVIVFLDDGEVVQYGQPKNLCYTADSVTVADP